MAALTPSHQFFTEDRSGRFFYVTRVTISGSSDTVDLPGGLADSAHVRVIPLESDDTAPSVTSITQNTYPAATTLTLAAGGTAGGEMFVVSMHSGNAAGGV